MRNIQPFNGFAPMQDIERLLNKMFPKNSALVLILLHARKLDGRFYLSGGLWSVLWPGLTIPAVFPKTMKCLSVLHKLFAPLLLSALYSSGFSLLVQLLISYQFNIDTACVELVFDDRSQISIDFTAVENEVADNRFQRSELDYLIYNDPLAYADLILNSKLNVLFEQTDIHGVSLLSEKINSFVSPYRRQEPGR